MTDTTIQAHDTTAAAHPDAATSSVPLSRFGAVASTETNSVDTSDIGNGVANHPASREALAFDLLTRGSATVDEILAASYGEWPPRGLDILGHNRQTVAFTSLTGHLNSWDKSVPPAPVDTHTTGIRVLDELIRTALPLARMNDTVFNMLTRPEFITNGVTDNRIEREIGINTHSAVVEPLINGTLPRAQSVLGHEVTHVLQEDHTSYRRASTAYEDAVLSLASARNTVLPYAGTPEADILAKSNLAPEYIRPGINLDSLSYIGRGIEIQARLHQVLSDGYQTWGRLPGSREELAVALDARGITMPNSLRTILDDSPTIAATRDIFRPLSTPQPPIDKHNPAVWALDHINVIQSALNDTGRDMFWRDTLPAMYGDLIEMYGDRDGRARMDLGDNPRLAMRLHQENLAHGNPVIEPASRAPIRATSINTQIRVSMAMANAPNAVGLGLGGLNLYQKSLEGSDFNEDMEAGGLRMQLALAGGAVDALDVSLSGAATLNQTIRTAQISRAPVTPTGQTLSRFLGAIADDSSKITRLTTRAALPLTLTSGLLEGGAGFAEGDGHRVARALGGTGGGILVGITSTALTGAALGTVFPGIGNVAGFLIGAGVGVVGAIGGSYYGAQLADTAFGSKIHGWLNGNSTPPPSSRTGSPPPAASRQPRAAIRPAAAPAPEQCGLDGTQQLAALFKKPAAKETSAPPARPHAPTHTATGVRRPGG